MWVFWTLYKLKTSYLPINRYSVHRNQIEKYILIVVSVLCVVCSLIIWTIFNTPTVTRTQIIKVVLCVREFLNKPLNDDEQMLSAPWKSGVDRFDIKFSTRYFCCPYDENDKGISNRKTLSLKFLLTYKLNICQFHLYKIKIRFLLTKYLVCVCVC